MAHRYPLPLRLLHWTIAVLILTLIALGWVMTELESSDPARRSLILLHKSLGLAVIALTLFRIAVRLASRIPPLPATIPAMERRLAHLSHWLLYAFMLAVPASGYVMSMASGFGASFFGIPAPNLIGVDRALAQQAHRLHEILPYFMLGLIALHVAGALKHRFFDLPENNVLPRMGFRWKNG